MRILRGALVVLLSYAIGVQPAVAQFTAVRAAAPSASGAGASAAAVNAGVSAAAPAVAPLTSLSAASLPVSPALYSAPAAFSPAAA
ncbi:MAG: hypothetical protein HY079_14825, partial [Elusimicrobia bacterium]|nr:hypothetical protein [Elusimicrobiota bacterium]